MNGPITWKEMEDFAKQLVVKVNENTPTAWYNADDSSLSFKNHGGGWQPLYTQPAKTLTDEEITAISKEIFKDYKNFHYYQIEFARAILRKAGEK